MSVSGLLVGVTIAGYTVAFLPSCRSGGPAEHAERTGEEVSRAAPPVAPMFAPIQQISPISRHILIGEASDNGSVVGVGDFNGDALPDLAFPSDTNEVLVALGNGDGTFRTPLASQTGCPSAGRPCQVTRLSVGDFNNDHRDDLVILSATYDTNARVLLSNRDGTLLQSATLDTLASVVGTGDFNHDGNRDVVTQSPTGGIRVFSGAGDGTFAQPPSDYQGARLFPQCLDLLVADVNADGMDDVVCADGSGGWVGTFLGTRTGALSQVPGEFSIEGRYPSCGALSSLSLSAGDINGDGNVDLVVSGGDAGFSGFVDSGFYVLFGNGDGTFRTLGGPNGDGFVDPSLGSVPGASLEYLAPGPATTPYIGSNSCPLYAMTTSAATADFNGDGWTDVGTVRVLNVNLPTPFSVFNGTSGGLILASSDPQLGGTATLDPFNWDPFTMTVADINLDGRPDVITSGPGVSVLLNTTPPGKPDRRLRKTKLVYRGDEGVDFHDTVTLGATLFDVSVTPPAPIPGAAVRFVSSTGRACTGYTEANGLAVCTVDVSESPGEYSVTAQFGNDGACPGSPTCKFRPSATRGHFVVRREEVDLELFLELYKGQPNHGFCSATGLPVQQGRPVDLAARLREHMRTDLPAPVVEPPLAGRRLVVRTGSPPNVQRCVATTDADGQVSCHFDSLDQPTGPAAFHVAFEGDDLYVPASADAQILVFSDPGPWSFAIGDTQAKVANRVTFWGTDWGQVNVMSGGPAVAAFNGFVEHPAPLDSNALDPRPWTSAISAVPPAMVPDYIAVVSLVNMKTDGTSFSGSMSARSIVKVDSNTISADGSPATGTIVADDTATAAWQCYTLYSYSFCSYVYPTIFPCVHENGECSLDHTLGQCDYATRSHEMYCEPGADPSQGVCLAPCRASGRPCDPTLRAPECCSGTCDSDGMCAFQSRQRETPVDAGSDGADAGSPSVDSGADAGPRCSLEGQQCMISADCCNGMPCAGSSCVNPG
jgi:FG-GAP-like repeat